MTVGILASDGVTELGRYDVQEDDGKVFIVSFARRRAAGANKRGFA